MESDEKLQRPLKPTNSTIRIAPVRRTTITPDAWGFHSVPRVLSDFQRHTSLSSAQIHPNKVHNRGHHHNHTHALVASEPLPPADRIISFLSFIAFPTALVALNHATAISWLNGGLIAGPTIIAAVALTNLSLANVISGILCLVGSATLAFYNTDPDQVKTAWLAFSGEDSVALISSLAVASLPRRGVLSKLHWAWLGSVIVFTAYLCQSWLSVPLLAVLVWSQLVTTKPLVVRARQQTYWGYMIGGTVSIVSLISIVLGTGVPPMLIVCTCLISTCSFGAFFLLGGTAMGGNVVTQSRYDCIVTGLLAVLVEAIVHSKISGAQFAVLMVLVPSIMFKDLKVTNDECGGHHSHHHETNSDDEDCQLEFVASSEATTRHSFTWSVLDSILAHDDTRSIFYFFLLNFSFMLVQLLYSVLSHSLGLLSDSIHMFFDCIALLVGLLASILAKFPPSSRFPFGLAMVETVSGFANGCLLLVISVGIIFEAMERVSNPVELEKVTELMVVSVLGLLVNMVGIFAFNHGHSHGGHSHSHGHSHSNSHSDHSHSVKPNSGHSHSHEHRNEHKLELSEKKNHECEHLHQNHKLDSHSHVHEHNHHAHDHSHESPHDCDSASLGQGNEGSSENLHGILLHIIADTLGSVGVIISTSLLKWTGWAGWDAVASIIISALIFISAIPLVKSSAKSLFLGLREAEEYKLRELLDAVFNVDGVATYKVPKFWDAGSGIRGLIHVQYADKADPNVVREKVRRVLVKGGVKDCVIQMEEPGAVCWCRTI